MFKKVDPKVNLPELETKILEFWEKNKIFEKSVEGKDSSKTFSFYDGPPFATGKPHYGHLLAGTIKDVIPRFKSMQGFKVERVWGWDTHGLPIENIVEQELDFRTKDQVEEYGIDKFNELCRTKVLAYADEWQKVVSKTGRWVDMKNAYLTMNPQFMESVWWAFKSLHEKDLAYEGHKVMPYCPRCATPLSNMEVGQGYKDKNDKAATVRFQSEEDKDTYFLAWTTTPWTLPGNLALAVGNDIDYVVVEKSGKKYILAKERLEHYKEELGDKVVAKLKGKELVGKKYKPVFDCYKNAQKAFEVVPGEHVNTDDGTGIVHTAPAFGEEDYVVAKAAGLDFFMPVDDLGRFTVEVPEYAGKSVIKHATNVQILEDLGEEVVRIEEIVHSYPHCWRCDTPLIYRGVASWFVAVEKIKEKMSQKNKGINWVPDKVGHARFANLIENAPDWSISRNRFWGTPLPVWKCKDCQKIHVLGSIEELEQKTGQKFGDIHLHKIMDTEIPCNCGGKAKLTREVFDCWFESGSMPYASVHYPYENEDRFKRDYPTDFIAEGIDQTRGWFYSLLVLSVALFDEPSYKNVIVNGTVLAEDGQKMSKKLSNYPDPTEVINKYGADAMRFYLMSSQAVRAGDLSFSEKGVDEVVKSIILRLWNSYSFFVTYASLDNWNPDEDGDFAESKRSLLDRWMISRRNTLVEKVTEALEAYDISKAARELNDFIGDLSNWYIRRSRKRFWKSEDDLDKKYAYHTLYKSLTVYCSLLAPFMPFVTEEIYQNLKGWRKGKAESVHLNNWPKLDKGMISKELEDQMGVLREAVEAGLSSRNELGIKVRQPLAKLELSAPIKLPEELLAIASEEVNVKKVELKEGKDLSAKLDTKITPELKAEGIARDFVRFIQDGRKKAGFNVEDRIATTWSTDSKEIAAAIESQSQYIAKETLSVKFEQEGNEGEYTQTVKLDGQEVHFSISRNS